ncbi:unnamed protein product [Chrysodeixis includens]|uniref:Uncharacterized protein n=1 Tax=Chrysodeixis includens TaxID=689277 RepID=A0A9N8Q0G6_CHRIL|nr:unnamed protein product [Chrysodeixis includens]
MDFLRRGEETEGYAGLLPAKTTGVLLRSLLPGGRQTRCALTQGRFLPLSSSHRTTESTRVTMRLTALLVMLMAALAMLVGTGHAAPQPKINVKAIKTTGKVLKKIVSTVSAAAAAHELYKGVKNHGQQG